MEAMRIVAEADMMLPDLKELPEDAYINDSLLHLAVVNDCLDCARILLAQGFSPNLTHRNLRCKDLLAMAAGTCKVEWVRLLLAHGAKVDGDADFECRTPHQIAARCSDPTVLQILSEKQKADDSKEELDDD